MLRLIFQRLGLVGVLLGVLLSNPKSAWADEKPLFQKTQCPFSQAPAALQQRLSCGRLSVKSADGSPFELAVVRRQAAEPVKGALPILYWPAGPGAALTPLALSALDLVPGHELILLDFRGSGASQPRFCTDLAGQLQRQMFESNNDAQWLEQRRAALQSCQQQMINRGYTAADFGSAQAVADAELLREILNIEQWHLYASGSATTVALHYLASARKSLKAVVLDGVYPPDELLLSAKASQDQWLVQLDKLCRQSDCQQRFGDITTLFNAALQKVAATPLALPYGHRTITLTADKLRLWTWQAGLQQDTLSLLPFWLLAVKQGQVELLGQWPAMLSQKQVLALDVATEMASECADRGRYYRGGGLDALDQLLLLPAGVCPAFSTGADAVEPNSPAVLPERAYMRTPLLMLSGSLDVRQPDVAVLQQWLGPVSQFSLVQGALQQVGMQNACQQKIVRDFFNNPLHFGLPACADAVTPPYLINALVPNALLADELQAARNGQWPWLLLGLPLLIVLAALVGPLWSLLAAVGGWLVGQPQRFAPFSILTNCYLVLLLGGWALLAHLLWQVQQRGSGEFWYGLPAGLAHGCMAVSLLSIGALALVHQLSARQHWRLTISTILLLCAALLGVYFQLLP